MQSSKKQKTAREAFDAQRSQYASIQKRLSERMVARAAEFARENTKYDLVADEGRVLHYLALALAAAGDRSAVNELGIPY
jgi:hypothetical protein